jgi:Protein of unknown function (DUF429)
MGWEHTTFIGIDVLTRGRGVTFTYAGLDMDLKLLAIGCGGLNDLLAYVGGQAEAFVAIDAPRRPNQGLMCQEEMRRQLNPPPSPGSGQDCRLAEYQLRCAGISIASTPAAAEDATAWMRIGFDLFHRLEEFGYHAYPAEGAARQSLEVAPQASFAVLLEQPPAEREALEGRMQRQLILSEQGVKLPDPLEVLEEVTRYRILKGSSFFKDIYAPAELDALVGAYTAWAAAVHPEQVLLLGDPAEGQIILPGALPAVKSS